MEILKQIGNQITVDDGTRDYILKNPESSTVVADSTFSPYGNLEGVTHSVHAGLPLIGGLFPSKSYSAHRSHNHGIINRKFDDVRVDHDPNLPETGLFPSDGLDKKELINTETMVKKIKECISAKKDENFKIIARSDAKSVEGIDKMIERCKAYIDAGAEIIFPEALNDEKDFEKVRKELSCYLLANMTEFGKSKLFNYKELEKFGYNIVIYPVTTQRLAMKSVEDGLRDIYKNGHQNNIINKMQTRKRLYELVDYEKYNSLDEKIYNFNTDGHE